MVRMLPLTYASVYAHGSGMTRPTGPLQVGASDRDALITDARGGKITFANTTLVKGTKAG
jgi:hypothetical protein